MARFPVSGHSIGTADFGGLNFGYAAVGAIGDTGDIGFERRLTESSSQNQHWNLPDREAASPADRIRYGDDVPLATLFRNIRESLIYLSVECLHHEGPDSTCASNEPLVPAGSVPYLGHVVLTVLAPVTYIEGVYDDEATINGVRLGNRPVSVHWVGVGC